MGSPPLETSSGSAPDVLMEKVNPAHSLTPLCGLHECLGRPLDLLQDTGGLSIVASK